MSACLNRLTFARAEVTQDERSFCQQSGGMILRSRSYFDLM